MAKERSTWQLRVDDGNPGRQRNTATGWAIPPFIIFQGKHHLSTWYKEEDLPHNWVIAVSEDGWPANKLGLQWLKHFDKHIKTRTVGMHQLLILDDHENHDSLEF
jgi:hypothetical protein